MSPGPGLPGRAVLVMLTSAFGWLSSTEMLLACTLEFAEARSGKPSSLKSAETADLGLFPPTGKGVGDPNPPEPSPRWTDTFAELASGTIRSGLPSPFRSAIVTEAGLPNAGTVGPGLKWPEPSPVRMDRLPE